MASSSRGVQQDSFIDDDDLTWCVHSEPKTSWLLQVLTTIPSSPLCVEEFDLSDRNFRPCPCGYQVRSDHKALLKSLQALVVILGSCCDAPAQTCHILISSLGLSVLLQQHQD